MSLRALLRLRFAAPALVVAAVVAALVAGPGALALVPLAAILVLAPVQWWTYRRCRQATRSGDAAARGWALDTLAVGSTLLVSYAVVVALAWGQLAAWPSEGTLLWPLLVLVGTALVYQAILLAHWALRRRLPARRWPWRALSFAGGLALTVAVDVGAQARALSAIAARHAPLVQALASSAAPCQDYQRFLDGYAGNPNHRPRSLHVGSGRSVLTFAGRSADMDGSTIVLDSSRPAATLFHNDDQGARRELQALQGSLEACAPQDAGAKGAR